MRILVDADGCPVVDIVLRTAKQFGVPVILVCATSAPAASKAGIRSA